MFQRLRASLIPLQHSQRGASLQKGASLVEYALLIAMISLVLFGTVGVLFGGISNAFNVIVDNL